MKTRMTREEYLQFRQKAIESSEAKQEILREYFNEKSPNKIPDYGTFFMMMYQYTSEYPFASETIDQFYPQVLEYYDKKFNINFLIKDYGEGNKVLFMMY